MKPKCMFICWSLLSYPYAYHTYNEAHDITEHMRRVCKNSKCTTHDPTSDFYNHEQEADHDYYPEFLERTIAVSQLLLELLVCLEDAYFVHRVIYF